MPGLDTVEVCIDLERFGHPTSWDDFTTSKAALVKYSPLNMIGPGWSASTQAWCWVVGTEGCSGFQLTKRKG